MKSKKNILMVIMIVLTALVFSACSDNITDDVLNLSAPENLIIKNGVMYFDNVKNADDYQVEINGEVFYTGGPNKMKGFAPNEEYVVRARALNIWTLSDWSEPFTFSILETPQNFVYFKGEFYWSEVPGASSYTIRVDGVEYDMKNSSIEEFTFSKHGSKSVQVKAVGNGVDVFDSLYSVPISVEVEEILWADVEETTPLGNGSSARPYQITSVENFKWIIESNNNYSKQFLNDSFIQVENIDFKYISGYEPIGTLEQPFYGKYDGDGYIIENLNIEGEEAGIFNYVGDSGKVINVVKNDGHVEGRNKAGGIVATNFGTIMNCVNTGGVEAGLAGGIVGENMDGKIVLNCDNFGSILGDDVGGIVGMNWNGSINSSLNYGSVSGINRSGGIVSLNGGTIINCQNQGNVSGGIVGGLAGENKNVIQTSMNLGSVEAVKYGGGLVGVNEGDVVFAYNTGSVFTNNTSSDSKIYIGGLVGKFDDGTLKGVFNTVPMSNEQINNMKVGGAVGYYRSGHLNYVFYNEIDLMPIGNESNYIGNLMSMNEADFTSKQFVEGLIDLKDYTDNVISNGPLWYVENKPYPQLYWEKNN